MTETLQKNKNVAKNVANENSQDLTEQMHKGELPYAEYYIKLAGGEYTNDVWDIGGWQSFNKKGDVVVEVLAPVPSYEEWQAKLEENKRLKHDVGNLGYKIKNQRHEIDNRLKEIERLKELLKEYKDITAIALLYTKDDKEFEKAKNIRERIDEVLK